MTRFEEESDDSSELSDSDVEVTNFPEYFE